MYTARHAVSISILLTIFLLCVPCAALYDFEGLAFRPAAQGEVVGEVVTAGTYGLTNPPMECRINLDRAPKWARIYCGVWGGTERYSGWAQFTINGNPIDRLTLYGQDDKNEGTYCAGHGVYWIAQDATTLLGPGDNVISVTTSKGEAGSKIDGRVYAVMVVAAVEKDGGETTRYVVLEGNENLHGEGWSGTNPTQKNRVEIPVDGLPTDEVHKADLSVLLVASGRGQPDYVFFNGADLGVVPATGTYLPGAKDIGDERSFDASGGQGIETRYVDMESFDITGLIRENNFLVFDRGHDLDGDGNISTTGATPEGEDYIHPCLAILTVTRSGTSISPALKVDSLEITNAYAGGEATISAVVRNTGSPLPGPVTIQVTIDGVVLESREVTLPPEGWVTVSVPWKAAEGTHALMFEASAEGAAPGKAEKSVMAGTPPDLVVSMSQPLRQDSAPEPHATTPFPLAGLAGGSVLGWWLYCRRPGARALIVAGALITAILFTPLVTAATTTSGQFATYTLPIEIRNAGGSDATSFTVTISLDGEKVAQVEIPGISSGDSVQEKVSLHTTPGTHTIVVIADEKGMLPELERENNRAEARYEFP
ncbi:MAG: hypothetical protein A4E38_00029 [Methanoregulaceae archaeon PtaB.Bin108]|nr:MAG: hypothetical protein A4E38_00029 [Methanoregulaceae archaeon PtaB.Bin108]